MNQARAQRGDRRLIALTATLTLSLAASPAVLQAATIIIDTPRNGTQLVGLGVGDTLLITDTGSITAPGTGSGDDGVRESSPIAPIASITNQGTITAAGDGIGLRSATVTGNVTNDTGGTIAAGEDGIYLFGTSRVEGSIVNANGIPGTIDAGGIGIALYTEAVVEQDIRNAGRITARGSDDWSGGISIQTSSQVLGNIENSGTIQATERSGIVLTSNAQVGGDVVNSGQVTAARHGLMVSGGSVTGTLRNEGTIDAGLDGIAVSNGATVGSIINAGGIDAIDAGIEVTGAGSTVQQDVTNTATGILDVEETGISVSDGGSVTGNLVNAGAIDSLLDGIVVQVGGSRVVGELRNSGSVTAARFSILVTSTGVVEGNVSNSGTLTGDLEIDGISSTAGGSGIDLTNSGDIDIRTSESSLSGDYTQTASGSFSVTLLGFASYTAAPMRILGNTAIDGGLLLSFHTGFGLSGGERFTLFDIGGTRTGTFGNHAQDAVVGSFGGYDLLIDYTTEGNIDLYSVPTPVPIPGTLALFGLGALAGLGGLARRRRPA